MLQIASVLIMMIGLYGLLTQKNIIKIIVSLNVMETGLNLFIVSVGYVKGGLVPILSETYKSTLLNFVDPLPQALVLTSIVIGVGTTALGLSFAKRIYEKHKTFELGEMEGIK